MKITALSSAVASILTLTLFVSVAQGQAWTREQGGFYLKLGYATLATEAAFGPDFEPDEIRPFSQHIVNLYGEIGLIDRWLTLNLSGELYRQNRLDSQGYTEGLGDVRVGLFTGLVADDPFRLALGAVVGLPTGDAEPTAGDGADPFADIIAASLPTGDGEVDIEWRLASGVSIYPSDWPLSHYVVVDVGLWQRTEGFTPSLTYRTEFGTGIRAEPWDRFLFIARLTGVESFASNEEAAESMFGLGNGVTTTSWGVELYARIVEGLGLSLGLEDIVRGRATLDALIFGLGLSYDQP